MVLLYLDYTVKIPVVEGKIVRRTVKDTAYVYYEYDRTYNRDKQYTNVSRVTIGKVTDSDSRMMFPNQNYLVYFPDEAPPVFKDDAKRSSCLRIGSNIVIDKIIAGYRFPELLGNWFKSEDLGLLLDLCSYTIICESNVGQYYPDYAYNHALHSSCMHIYSDSKVSSFLNSMLDHWA